MEGWNEIVLGKLGDTFTGLSGKTKDDFGFGSKYIQYVNIFNNSKIDIENLELVNVKSNEKQSKVKFGDIFFTTSSETIEEVGMSSVLLDEINEDIYLNSFCFGFRLFDFENLLPEFAQHLLRSAHMRHSISMFGKGSTRYNLSKTLLLKDLVLVFPSSHTEQQKIATILNTLDQSIAQTKRLIAKYKNIKQGLMYDLLTYGIDENGTIRKPETHTFMEKEGILMPNEWSVDSLGFCFTNFKSGNSITAENIFKIAHYPVYGGNGLRGYTNTYTHSGKYVLIGRQGALCGNINMVTGENYISEHAIAVQTNTKNDIDYWYYKLDYMNLNQYSAQSAQPGLAVEKLVKLIVSIPKFEEQEKIAQILKQQDNLIDSEQTNLAKLQKLKQGLMSDLLTGKIRVKI